MEASDVPEQEVQVRVGAEVITSDDKKLGTVRAADAATLTVEKGLLAKKAVVVPRHAIANFVPGGAGTIYLSMTEDQVRTGDWMAGSA